MEDTKTILTPVPPMPSSFNKRRVNFYFAKPKEKSLTETTNDMSDELKPQFKSGLALKETFTHINQNKVFNCVNLKKWKYAEIEAEAEVMENPAVQKGIKIEENFADTPHKSTHYDVILDKNFDIKVNAIVAELDSKYPILLRNSFLYEEPITWQRKQPFSKISPKRSLSILSANFLQFDDANENMRSKNNGKDFLSFPNPNVALLLSIDYDIEMETISDLVFSE